MKILTEQGYKKFDGFINQGIPEVLLNITFSCGESIRCTEEHEFLAEDGWVPAALLEIGDVLSGKKIESIEYVEPEPVYDALNVEDTQSYITNGVVSHNCSIVYVDETAFINKNIADEFFAAVFPTLAAGTDSKLFLSSTPKGYNHFWKFWNEAEKGLNGFEHMFIHWSRIPGRTQEWADERRKDLGDVKFNQEYECKFLGSSHTLIAESALSAFSAIPPISSSDDGLDVYKEPDGSRQYLITVDTATGKDEDYSAFIVFDITDSPYEVVAKYRNNKISSVLYPEVIARAGDAYGNALVLVEINNNNIADILHEEIEYENLLMVLRNKKGQKLVFNSYKGHLGLTMDRRTKRIGCFNLKSLVEEGKIIINDADIMGEFSTFIQKGNSWQAEDGYNDDLVMCMVVFGWAISNDLFKEIRDVTLRETIYGDKRREMIDDMIPFGFIDNGIDSLD